MSLQEELVLIRKVHERLYALLKPFVRAEDAALTDQALVSEAYRRHLRYLSDPVLDPNE